MDGGFVGVCKCKVENEMGWKERGFPVEVYAHIIMGMNEIGECNN